MSNDQTKINGRVLTIHEKIQEAHLKHVNKYVGSKEQHVREYQGKTHTDIELLTQMLQCILDKLQGMDQFMRTLDTRFNTLAAREIKKSSEEKTQVDLVNKIHALESQLEKENQDGNLKEGINELTPEVRAALVTSSKLKGRK